jgi:hypothetical protein
VLPSSQRRTDWREWHNFGAKLLPPLTSAIESPTMTLKYLPPTPRLATRVLILAALFCSGITQPRTATADTEKLNGNWVLDEAVSESYVGATKILKAELLKRNRRRTKDGFNSDSKGHRGNKYYEQERASKRLRAADTVNVDWTLPGDLDVVMKAKTVKIYQSRMCAVLYDQRFKRLIAINPAGNSYSAKGTEFARDGLGRAFSYFERETLVIDTEVKGGDQLIEKFSLDEAGDELKILTRYRRSDLGRTMEYTRVYRRGEVVAASP